MELVGILYWLCVGKMERLMGWKVMMGRIELWSKDSNICRGVVATERSGGVGNVNGID